MKIRQGFVSNSSSSSFVCEICGRTEVLWDGADEGGYVYCEREHLICESMCGTNETNTFNLYEKGENGKILSSSCPICQMVEFSESDLKKYLQKTTGITDETVFNFIKTLNKRRKKLYPGEYITYILCHINMTMNTVQSAIKNNFKDYSEFLNFIS
jgi:hypothetical protein